MSFDRKDARASFVVDPEGEFRSVPALSASMRSISKAGRVLFALTQFYLPVYEQPLRTVLFDHFDVFGCLSAGIYEVDEMIEAGVPVRDALPKLTALQSYLASKVVCDEYMQGRFQDARTYYEFEEKLRCETITYTFDELAHLTAIRSFDFRIMHQALIQFAASEHDASLFAWFRLFEMLMEVEDDLNSTVDDFQRGTYNIFCLAARLSRLDGPTFVNKFRDSLEKNLRSSFREVSPRFARACDLVWSTYRDLVPRPKIPTIWL